MNDIERSETANTMNKVKQNDARIVENEEEKQLQVNIATTIKELKAMEVLCYMSLDTLEAMERKVNAMDESYVNELYEAYKREEPKEESLIIA